jgi:hypothetical protein
LCGRFVAAHPFQAAQQHGGAVALGELPQFVKKDLPHLAPADLVERVRGRLPGRGGFPPKPLDRLPPGVHGEVAGDFVEPARQGLPLADRRRLAGEDGEGGLEGVLGGVVVAQNGPANAVDHRPVPPHQRLEGRLVAPGRKGVQAVAVGRPVRSAARQPAQVVQDRCGVA